VKDEDRFAGGCLPRLGQDYTDIKTGQSLWVEACNSSGTCHYRWMPSHGYHRSTVAMRPSGRIAYQ